MASFLDPVSRGRIWAKRWVSPLGGAVGAFYLYLLHQCHGHLADTPGSLKRVQSIRYLIVSLDLIATVLLSLAINWGVYVAKPSTFKIICH